MSVTTEKTVRELALESPAATRVLEKLGIDYCCGGNRTLDEACRAAGIAPAEVLDALAETSATAVNDTDWLQAPLADLVAHVQNTHHAYVREASARISGLAAKVVAAHGANHPEVREVDAVFLELSAELATHLMKEEAVLFPYIVRMEEEVLAGEPVLPPPFGTARNPVRMMMAEHDGAGDSLRRLRALSGGYAPPADACATFRALYAALDEFEADLHQHIHLENNILFPRALAMEAGA